ncbi:MAG: UDP-glucose 6-dehydrogenase [Omnitrophica WOR_2 bacterium GWF2_43_52]|nr:MAG: UDP-glucose 6-dehydrogenase [Omnitrophica WOR_2 bacterium GWA2_44_7]OGX21134.1 MAG: UDP-glucose 6-dehydrogenase [Omnitrophica WOR_2 bacterium GWF2_43_52]HAH19928.1 UDP-glucose 6-dehydrogenase [Candidatus Omnitrophota bacterium]HBG62917.1 UDP-glucose 6-dehydrogenase [Candidatus Omnitrophota bacterium]
MNIAIIGTGYVGLVTGACFADLGNTVICVDNNKDKIASLKKLIMPIYEPGLDELVRRNVKEKRLCFSADIKEALRKSKIIFIAVGTPPLDNGDADLTGVENVAKAIAKNLNGYKLIVEKSTVPVETGFWVEHTIKVNLPNAKKGKISFDVASNPEFLREGQAINDFMHPDRIVIGVESQAARELLCDLYKPLKTHLVVTDIKSAEIIKHASNSFLATKISFINAIAQICERVGADVVKVADGMGMDKRIGRAFLDAGIGYGGSCFPKDLDAFITIARKNGYDFELLKAVRDINEYQKKDIVKKIKDALWILKDKRICLLGLSFKPNTDDLRSAPSLAIIESLQSEGAKIRVFDPQSMEKAKEIVQGVTFCKDAYQAAKGADCVVIVTEWNEFKELDVARLKKIMHQPLIIDGRNIYEPQVMKKNGFRYIGMGRGKRQ